MTVWNYIRQHKYLITILAFLVIIVFLDENSLIQRAKQRQEINALTSEIEKYRKQYEAIYSDQYMGKNSDAHKECIFQNKEGNVNVILENMYRPQFRLLLESKRQEK